MWAQLRGWSDEVIGWAKPITECCKHRCKEGPKLPRSVHALTFGGIDSSEGRCLTLAVQRFPFSKGPASPIFCTSSIWSGTLPQVLCHHRLP